MPPSELETWLIEQVARRVGVASTDIDVHASFEALGLDSAALVELSGELEAVLDRSLSPTLLLDAPSIALLAGELIEPVTEDATAPVTSAPSSEPVTVLGAACRVPGAQSLQELWSLLITGGSAIRAVPSSRWDAETLARRRSDTSRGVRVGGFIDLVEGIDGARFGVAPRELRQMDPQQLLVLDLAWQAFEDACLTRNRLRSQRTGVFVGVSATEHQHLQMRSGALREPYGLTGASAAIVANRVSYAFDLCGPSIVVDAACASSLVAIHLACAALLQNECDVALAGGVSLMLVPEATLALDAMGVLSASGVCRPFDAAADGYVRGEGAGLLVLARRSRARGLGIAPRAELLGSAVLSNGRSNGLTAPRRSQQKMLLRAAYARAGVSPGAVGFVESHGTGTLLGDAVEATALGEALTVGRPLDRPCVLGSVKGNVGHLDAAAGVTGVVKAMLAIEHGELPGMPNLHEPSSAIPWEALPLEVSPSRTSWGSGVPRIAGVTALGFGGTSAHVVLAQPEAGA